MVEKASTAFDESMEGTGLNSFDVIFGNYMSNPESGFICQEQVLHPDRSRGWLHNQLNQSEQRETALALRDGNGEMKVALVAHYDYPNADVYMVKNQFKKYLDSEVDFLVVDKDPHALDATLLSFKGPELHKNPVPGMLRIDASPDFL